MPPARKTTHVINEPVKRPLPRHVINIAELIDEQPFDSKYYLRVKINKDSPQEITLKKRGKVLTVDTKTEGLDERTECHTRHYNIPNSNQMQEFASQISTDGLLDLGGPGMKPKGRVFPIQLNMLPKNEHKIKVFTIDKSINKGTNVNNDSKVKAWLKNAGFATEEVKVEGENKEDVKKEMQLTDEVEMEGITADKEVEIKEVQEGFINEEEKVKQGFPDED